MPKRHAATAADPSIADPSETAPEAASAYVGAWEDAARVGAVRARRRRLAETRAAWRQALRRRGVMAFLAAMSVSVGAAVAHDGGAPAGKTARKGAVGPSVAAIQRALGVPADGIFGPQTRRAVRRFQRREGLAVDGIVGPVTLQALGLARSPARALTGSQAVLRAIAQCESGGDPQAVSPDGRYRGKYQFTRATWRALGGEGDPAQATEAMQDRLAALLLAREGTRPWPACSARL